MGEPNSGRTAGPSKFYDDVLDAKLWNELCGFVEKIDFGGPRPDPSPPYRGLAADEIDKVAARVRERLPFYLKVARRRAASDTELDDLDNVVRGYLEEAFRCPTIDVCRARETAEAGGYRFGFAGGDFFVTRWERPGLILADVKGGGVIEIGNEEKEGTAVQKVAFVVDIVIEVIGAVLGIIGFRASLGPNREAIDTAVRNLLSTETGRTALKALIDGLKNGDPVAILVFLEFLEQSGNLAEFLAHFFAGLSLIDYLITAAKCIAWIVAAATTGGIAVAAKIAGLILDLVGLGEKLLNADEVF